MAVNFLQQKGTLPKQDTSPLLAELAQQTAMDDIQKAEAVKTAEDENPLRTSATNLLLKQLETPVNTPKATTLRDVLTADKNRMNVFADYIQSNPDFTRLVGNLVVGTTWDKNHNPVYGGEDLARRKETDLYLAQQNAADAEKARNALAQNIYGEENKIDLANMEDLLERDKMAQDAEQFAQNLDFSKEQFAQQMALDRMKFAEDQRHNKAMEANGGRGGLPSFSNITTVRKEFSSLPAIKNYDEINSRKEDINAIKEALRGHKSLNAEDQALIMNFNKALDPISVVRESEFARTAEGQSVIDRFNGAMAKFARGGSGLSRSERDAIYKVINVMSDTAAKNAKLYIQDYVDLANRYGINPKDIINTKYYSLLDTTDSTPAAAPSTSISPKVTPDGGRAWER